MARHHDELVHELGTGRIEWAAALVVFGSLGLTDDHGRRLTRDTASRTWRRVRTAVAAARQAEARTAPRPGELVRGVRQVAPPPPSTRTAPPPASPVTAPSINGVDEATERIAAVLAGMGASRVPLPSQPVRQHQPVPMRPAPDEDFPS
ncbi:hypothetical protein [Methylobacterium sp. WCS2018Hpa-22]|jgi:hypothetical protein|uniref:hypothetical protein n=1 Tax=Methylobacterium sp. WCS2018Hpa-22 TaxID=3073633 RepID=UPI00288B9995|nr:hypothetical protein [Methylobacterium sp. WCS2018Hpa-22]